MGKYAWGVIIQFEGQHYIITVGLDRIWRGVLGLFRGFSDVSCQALISCYFHCTTKLSGSSEIKTYNPSTFLASEIFGEAGGYVVRPSVHFKSVYRGILNGSPLPMPNGFLDAIASLLLARIVMDRLQKIHQK